MGHRIRRIISAGTFVRLAASIILSFVIWGFIVWETNPEITREFPSVLVAARNVPGDMLIVGELPTVSVTIKGPQDVIRGVGASNVAAWIDLGEIESPGIDEYEVQVEAPDGLRQVVIEPSVVEVELDLIVTETFQVVIREDEPRPANVSLASLSTELVSIQGPQDLVLRVEAVEALIDLSDRSASFTEQLELIPIDSQGTRVEGVSVSPETVELTVTFETTSKDVPVSVFCACIVDDRLQEMQLSTAAAIPSTVRLSGPASALATISSVPTIAIDTSALEESGWILDVELNLSAIPDSITVGERSVDVWVPVVPGRQELTDVPIDVFGLTSGLEATLSEESVSIVVVGAGVSETAELEQQIDALIDLRGLTQGTYTVDVAVVVPPGLSFEQVTPATVRVVIQIDTSLSNRSSNRDDRVQSGIR